MPTVTAALLAIAILFAPPVHAEHVPGAIYTGKNSRGGKLKLVVSKDGASLASFTSEVPCAPGNILLVEETFAPGIVPISNHAFTFTVSGVSAAGSFIGANAAAGTLNYQLTGPGPCTSGAVTWTATVDASAPQMSILDDVLVLLPFGGLSVRILCPAEDRTVCAGELKLQTLGGTVLGTSRFRAAPGATKIVDVAFFARGLKAAVGRTLRARVIVTTRDEVGNEATAERTVTLKAGLPDLYVAAFTPSKEEGDLCRPGELHHVRWKVVVRNLGPGVGPPAFKVRIGPRVVTVRQRLGVRKRFALPGSIPGRIRVVVDPAGRIEESNERNNALRSPAPVTLVCNVVG